MLSCAIDSEQWHITGIIGLESILIYTLGLHSKRRRLSCLFTTFGVLLAMHAVMCFIGLIWSYQDFFAVIRCALSLLLCLLLGPSYLKYRKMLMSKLNYFLN